MTSHTTGGPNRVVSTAATKSNASPFLYWHMLVLLCDPVKVGQELERTAPRLSSSSAADRQSTVYRTLNYGLKLIVTTDLRNDADRVRAT